MAPIIRDRHTLKALPPNELKPGQPVYAPNTEGNKGGYRPAVITTIDDIGNGEWRVTWEYTERNKWRVWEPVSESAAIVNEHLQ